MVENSKRIVENENKLGRAPGRERSAEGGEFRVDGL